MGGSSEVGPASPPGGGDGEPTRTFVGRDAPARPAPADPAHPPTQAVPSHPPTQAVPPGPPAEVVRYGPGVPASLAADQAGQTAERIWRTGQTAPPGRRTRRLRRLLGPALTVILLAASGVVLYLRFYHPPFHVTGAEISRPQAGCVVDVTGRISTNGAAGTVSYQWVFTPGRQPPRPLSQSVRAGQHTVYATATVEGSGHGSASRTATLQVLSPDPRAVSTTVVLRC